MNSTLVNENNLIPADTLCFPEDFWIHQLLTDKWSVCGSSRRRDISDPVCHSVLHCELHSDRISVCVEVRSFHVCSEADNPVHISPGCVLYL